MSVGVWGKLERSFKILPLVEFTYNNSYQASIGMAPYKALYGSLHLLGWSRGEMRKSGKRIKEAQNRHERYADNRRRPLEFQERDKVFLKVAP
jgi:hypothetical protein